MGEEEIGYAIELNGNQIDLDYAMNNFKEEIHADYPSASIKVYPCNFTESCSNFNEILSTFKSDDVDIGILIGVVGVDEEEGSLRWQMISNDDTEPNPTTFDSDTCYYFNEEKVYTHKEFCTEGITPSGVLQNLDGFSFDYNFRFADPELTPKTLTTASIKDSLGNWIDYGSTEEPLLNEAYLMGKYEIFARLATSIPNNNGNSQHTAFDYHFFAPWTLYWESGGNSAPFDFSAKAFFLDRQNYIFITDDGDNVVGHNFRNMGNFLWGAATYIMGVPQWMALAGAHGQNIFGEFGDGGLDSPDDQYSIKLGRYYAKQMDWQTIYGGKNNIFRK